MGNRRLTRKLEENGLAALVGGIHGELFFDAAWPSADLEEFLRASSTFGSFDLNLWMAFTRSEIAKARFLLVRPQKVIEDTTRDYERMRDEFDLLPWIGNDPMFRCRVPDNVYLSRIDLKPNQIAAVGQWTAEYVVGSSVRKAFKDAALTNIEFRPVLKTRTGEPIDGYAHLHTEKMLARRTIDIASLRIESRPAEEQGYHILGCFCYDSQTLADASDFNRTGESNVGFQFPEWIVSAKVRDVYTKNMLRGWRFQPVLEPGSAVYDDYVALWSSLFACLAACRKHSVLGHAPPASAD